MIAMIQWHSSLNPLVSGVMLMAAAFWLVRTYRQWRLRWSRAQALWLIIPRTLIVALLTLALFDPAWRRETSEPVTGKILALLDISSSMDVRDDGHEPRISRARTILDKIKRNLPRGITVETVEFNSSLRTSPSVTNHVPPHTEPRSTDLGACLLALSERSDISSCLGIVLLTDGGDAPLQNARLPPIPLSIVGMGTDPAIWNDVAVGDLQAPPAAEENIDFGITAELQARAGGDPAFASRLSQIPVVLENESKGAWNKVAESRVNLSRHRAQVTFRTSEKSAGLQHYRVSVEPVRGELSLLNNTRHGTVEIRKKSLHVLYFTRELGTDFKLIRNELDRDPGISFTALFRTVSEHFTVQGDRVSGDDELPAGFPASEKTLKLYDGLIIGSFPAEGWTREQIQALMTYVEEGGSVIFLAGSDTFGRRGYAPTPLAALFPWQLEQSDPEVMTGAFPVSIPPTATGHPIIAGLDQRLKEESPVTLDSVYRPGPLKVGATSLLDAQLSQRIIPVIALQPFGKGKVLGLASNTLWKWARRSKALKEAHGLFWRQAVRHMTGHVEGGRLLALRWDQERYKPGEQAVADIRVAGLQSGGALRLSASLADGRDSAPLMVEPTPGQPDAYAVKMAFKHRGDYLFRLTASDGAHLLETHEKTLNVAPLYDEGSHLELNEAFLTQLAERGSGMYAGEGAVDPLIRHLQTQVIRKSRVMETPIIQAGPWFALLILALLVVEWILRRRMNLI